MSTSVSLVSFSTNEIDRRTIPLIKFNHVTLDYSREITVPKADDTGQEYNLSIGFFSFVFLFLVNPPVLKIPGANGTHVKCIQFAIHCSENEQL